MKRYLATYVAVPLFLLLAAESLTFWPEHPRTTTVLFVISYILCGLLYYFITNVNNVLDEYLDTVGLRVGFVFLWLIYAVYNVVMGL